MKLDYLKQISIQTALWMLKIPSERAKAYRQLRCAEELEYALEKGTLEMYLNRANFCNNRACSICNWRKSSKKRIRVFPGIKRYIEDFEVIPLLLTLTIKNCHQSDLRWVIRRILQPGWKRFQEIYRFPAVGWLKSLEVTRPRDCFYRGRFIGRLGSRQIKNIIYLENFNVKHWQEFISEECHPHYHLLLFVSGSYFNEPNYIQHHEWVVCWRQSLRVDYDPVVDIRRIYSDNGSLDKAILETTKYCLKPNDMADRMAPFIFRQLHGLRLNSVGGELRRYINEGDLSRIDKSGKAGNEFHQDGLTLVYEWDSLNEGYKISKLEV